MAWPSGKIQPWYPLSHVSGFGQRPPLSQNVTQQSAEKVCKTNGDADEAPDQVELAGSSMVVLTGVYTDQWPAKCPGVMCYRRADDCNVCVHGGAKLARTHSDEKMDMTDVEELLKKFGTLHLPTKEVKRAFQSRNDALYEQYALVSTCRGNRVRSELRMSGRMGF